MSDDGRIVTERLVLRRWSVADREPMAEINRDPEVTRYLNRRPSASEMDDFLERAEAHWREHGFGWYAVEGATGDDRGRLLGFVGIALPTFIPEIAARPELGWRLAHHAWGRGLATEGARAVREHVAANPALHELISIIDPGNERSQRVAMKLGMNVERQVLNPLSARDVDVWSTSAGA